MSIADWIEGMAPIGPQSAWEIERFFPSTRYIDDLVTSDAIRLQMNMCNKKVVRKTIKSGEKKQKSRERIIQILKEHPDYSARKLAEIIGVTPKAIEKHLARLKADGIIQRDGPDKGGNWRVL